MKRFIIVSIFLTLFNWVAFPSTLIRVEKGSELTVSIWKHTEDYSPDQVMTKNFSNEEMSEISNMLIGYRAITLIFNKGVFTSLKYDGSTKKTWASLSNAEKDMVTHLQERFNVAEK